MDKLWVLWIAVNFVVLPCIGILLVINGELLSGIIYTGLFLLLWIYRIENQRKAILKSQEKHQPKEEPKKEVSTVISEEDILRELKKSYEI